ncbi:hypothetical protein [Kaistia adipata]|uniref:hypothetical protein n=1 Tax=Kaistia adipata TaxID=166954 RepID=UPI0003FAA04F|nr:hypothetical protein [Kaistia adipata]
MSAFNLSAIMKEAHAQARRYAKPGQYRKALVWALRMAWHAAKSAARFAAVLITQTPEQRQRFDAAMAIEAKDRLSHADRHQLAELRAA